MPQPAAATVVDRRSPAYPIRRTILILSMLGWSWLAMMAVHEFGHVVGARVTRGNVAKVVLYPTSFSRTELVVNPHPAIVAWAGPLVGTLLPLLVLGIVSMVKMPGRYMLRFFAGFALVANGAYLGTGWLINAGDAGDLLRHGAAAWQLCVFGVVATSLGLLLWHGQGRHFGLGKDRANIAGWAAYGSLGLLGAITMVEVMVGGE